MVGMSVMEACASSNPAPLAATCEEVPGWSCSAGPEGGAHYAAQDGAAWADVGPLWERGALPEALRSLDSWTVETLEAAHLPVEGCRLRTREAVRGSASGVYAVYDACPGSVQVMLAWSTEGDRLVQVTAPRGLPDAGWAEAARVLSP